MNSPIAPHIDHTLLKAQASRIDYERLCQQAIDHQFYSVCVPPFWVEFCRKQLAGSPCKTITVVGFPLGYQLSSTKVQETRALIDLGAQEIDMVLNVSAALSGDWGAVQRDVELVREASLGTPLKVIVETCYFSPSDRDRAALISEAAGANFIKTSTGFGTAGAEVSDIKRWRSILKSTTQIKASGGIKTRADAQAMLAAGASRLGTSASVDIVLGHSSNESQNGY
jgi:deoxyribose-phosphate aldolase